MSTRLWYEKYNHDWMRALPLGNGRIGAMFYGNSERETIEINEESLWSGRQLQEAYNSSPEALQKIRKLLFEEKYEEAAKVCEDTFLANPQSVRFYESFEEIFIDFKDKRKAKNYCKELELSEAIARARYDKGDVHYESEAFVSEEYDVFVYKVSTNNKIFSCDITMKRAQDAYTSTMNENTLLLNGQIIYADSDMRGDGGEGMKFAANLHIVTDGIKTAKKDSIYVDDATYVIIYASFSTNYNVLKYDIDESIDYKKKNRDIINTVKDIPYDEIKEKHINDHKEKFDKVKFELDAPNFDDTDTDWRLGKIMWGEKDLEFLTLYYNFGRYLLLASSGGNAVLPANLQGIWATGFTPPWGSDYHTNINLQMNYWPALNTNMFETMKPFIHFMKMISKFGVPTAKKMFDANGWVINHTTDVFGRTGAHDSVQCGFFPMAGPWLCINLWEQYEFTNDINILKDIYPVLKGSCEFIKDFLIEGEDGYLVTNPSNSPENNFYYIDENGNKKQSMFTYGATIDFEIIDALLTRTVYACEKLGIDGEFSEKMKKILTKLPPLRISERYGTVCEWIKDYEETEPQHRHISHMFALYPGDAINENNPEIYEAAKKTIERRLSFGGGATGWSRAWIINFYARLKDGNKALEHLNQLMIKSTAFNLFDMHPPFQIDGNFGATAGITEMLIQSHLGTFDNRIIEILPALPEDWKNGLVKGLRARGNFEFDIYWKNNKPVRLNVKSYCDNILRLKITDFMKKHILADKEYKIENSVLYMDMRRDEIIEINFM